MTVAVAPVSAWGGGVAVLPWKGAQVSVSVLDPNGTPTDNSFDDAFDGGILLGTEGCVTINPFGLVRHQLIGFMWSNKERTSLIQDPSNLALIVHDLELQERDCATDLLAGYFCQASAPWER
jgi:porin